MKNLVLSILIIGAVSIAGYLIFTIEYQEDNDLGLYILELPINDEVDFYNISEPSHTRFDLTRATISNQEIIKIQNAIDEELSINISPVKDYQMKETPYTFPAKNDERNLMYLDIIMKESLLVGIAAVGLFLLNRPEKEKDIVE